MWWWCTLWLWLTVCHGKIHHAIKNGKPSISLGHRKTMAMLNNQRVWFVSGIHWINIGLGLAACSILSIFHNPNQQNYRWTGLGWCLGWSMDNLKSPPQLGLESYRNVRLKKIKLGMWRPIFPLRTWIFRTVTDKLLIPSDCQVANLKRTHHVGICHKNLDVESSTTSFTRDHLRPLQREETTPDFHNSSSSLGSRNHVELSRCHQEQRQTWFPKRWIFLAAPWWRHLSFLLLYFSEIPNFSDPFPSKYVPVASLWVSDSQKFWGPIHKISIHGISWMDLVCRTPQPLRLRLTMHQDTHGSGRSQGLKDWWGQRETLLAFKDWRQGEVNKIMLLYATLWLW